jgi:predicted ATPase/class 3 adenylate cyclase/DNA-binding CsgD family transcriptional regulator
VVTFLMTDVESSTQLWRDRPEAVQLLERQRDLVAGAIAGHGGALPADQGEGDSALAAFARPGDALAAALDAQRALAAEPWPEGARVRVRMAVHTGVAELRGEHNYGGLALIRCARLRALARGGQVLVSSATVALVGDPLPGGASLVDLETVSLADFERPERVHQLCHSALPSEFAPLRRSASTLQPWSTPLVGRAAECREVVSLLGDARLVTLTGAGGSGKTRLAHAVALDLEERFEDGVVWVELARLASEAQVAGTVAAACGVAEAGGVRVLDALARHLASTELLLVLDNCEHLLGACAELADAAVRAGARVRVLATSREPLGAPGETTWRIPSLALPAEDAIALADVAESEAVRLFVERARAARPDFRLDAASAPAVARICRRLDGIPLALELAAARVRALSIEHLADGLDDRFRLLTGGARTAMARQRTLLASVEWSHALLDDDERALFRRLSVFAAPFSLAAAEAVAADDSLDRFAIFEVLARLVDKSLVMHAGDRYRLLETLRQYALERAADAGELAELRERHLAWFKRRAGVWRIDREIYDAEVMTAQVLVEAPDLISALDWSIRPDHQPAVELLWPVSAHWFDRGNCEAEIRSLATKVLGQQTEGSKSWLELLAPLCVPLLIAGEASWLPSAGRALAELGSKLDPILRADISMALSLGSVFLGDREAAIAGLRAVVEDAKVSGCQRLEVLAVAHLAMIHSTSSEARSARPLLAWLDRQVSPGHPFRSQIAISNAWLAAASGDLDVARGSLAPYLEQGAKGGIYVVGVAGQIGLWLEDQAYLARLLMLAERLHFPANALSGSTVPELRGKLALLRGDLEAAAVAFDECGRWSLMRDRAMSNQLRRAEVRLALGDRAGAEADVAVMERALSGSSSSYALLLDLLKSHLARLASEPTRAESLAHAALARSVDLEAALIAVWGLEVLILVAGDADRLGEAARLLGAVEAFRARSGFRWRAHHYREALARLRAKLDPTALAEGAELAIWDAVAYAQRGRGERGRPDRGWQSLTPTEQRVVELVSAGLPNKDVAQKLFVSVATVKTHLVHVFEKLDVRTRAELAATVAARRASGS